MPGKGKYTTYTTTDSNKKTFLDKIFAGNSQISPPYKGMDEAVAINYATGMGNAVLRGGADGGVVDTKDLSLGKVDLTYSGGPDTRPSATQVKFQKPGDPANPYTPDLRSPGPTEPGNDFVLTDAKPEISPQDIKPNFNEKSMTNNTSSPAVTSVDVYKRNTLGT